MIIANGIDIYLGDCLDVMPTLGEVDLVLTDPPYGITQNKWDAAVPLPEMWRAIGKVTRDNTPVVLTSAQPFTSALVMSNVEQFRYDWIWRKPKGTGHLNAKKQPMRDKEDILVFYKKQCLYNPQMTAGAAFGQKAGPKSGSENYGSYGASRAFNHGTRYPKQVQDFGVVERATVHPTQKPVELMEYLIKTYTNGGDTVLDFTMGSGTTGVACVNTGRKFIGIELNEHYFGVAASRISEAHCETL